MVQLAVYRPVIAAAAALVLASSLSAHGALTAHYTLDDLGSGIQNQGTDGATSDLTAANAAATPTVVAGLIGAGALSFDGGDLLRALTAGNAADDLTAYPFTMAFWVRSVSPPTGTGARSTIMTISQRS